MGGHEKTYFEQQREALIGEIAMVCAWFLLTCDGTDGRAEL